LPPYGFSEATPPRLTGEIIDDHLGFIARGSDDLTNLELGLLRLNVNLQSKADFLTAEFLI
jgi:hypothetical protein